MDAAPGDGSARVLRPYTKGYGVGGGSNVNGMAADRGLPDDYDAWRNLGVENWGWEDVLPYFKKMDHDLNFVGALHGDRGPMPVRRLPQARWAPFAAAIGRAIQRRGFPLIDDYMADARDGLNSVPTNCLPHGRLSASMAYLTTEVRCRRNLVILTDARVERLSLDGARADGVFVHMGGATILIRGREIILACGAIQSPTLLMRSGIGPGEHLRSHGIGVVRDLRGVGANLQNHPCVILTTYLPREA